MSKRFSHSFAYQSWHRECIAAPDERLTVHNYVCGDCAGCELASKCKTNPSSKVGRKVSHDEYEGERRRQRERMQPDETKQRYNQRSHYGETPFAVMKAAMSKSAEISAN